MNVLHVSKNQHKMHEKIRVLTEQFSKYKAFRNEKSGMTSDTSKLFYNQCQINI